MKYHDNTAQFLDERKDFIDGFRRDYGRSPSPIEIYTGMHLSKSTYFRRMADARGADIQPPPTSPPPIQRDDADDEEEAI